VASGSQYLNIYQQFQCYHTMKDSCSTSDMMVERPEIRSIPAPFINDPVAIYLINAIKPLGSTMIQTFVKTERKDGIVGGFTKIRNDAANRKTAYRACMCYDKTKRCEDNESFRLGQNRKRPSGGLGNTTNKHQKTCKWDARLETLPSMIL